MADETTQGVHPFTVAWWRRLPTVYRAADRVQGYRLTDAWPGLNRDPRFITGWDGWYRSNVSTKPWVAAVAFTRTFAGTPNVPLHIRSWHEPWTRLANGSRQNRLEGVAVRHVVRSYTGQVIADHAPASGSPAADAVRILDGGGVVVGNEDIYDGGTPAVAPGAVVTEAAEQIGDQLSYHTVVTPDRFGTVTVTVIVALDVTDLDLTDDHPVGARDLMEAIHVGHGDTTFQTLPGVNYFATGAAYPLLRFLDGMGHQIGFLSDAANDMHSGAWFHPATAPEASLLFLASVMGVSQKYARSRTSPQLREHLLQLTEGNNPTPGSRQHIAITARQHLTGSRTVSVIPAHSIKGFTGEDPLHTLVVTARADQVPGNDLAAFEAFLNNAGVIPAGHRVIVREAIPTWDQWETTSGQTWNDQAGVFRTWNDSDSAGIDFSAEGA